jgi:hypothetical protein
MGNAPESMVDPNGMLPTYSSDGVRNDELSGNARDYTAFQGGGGTSAIGGGGGFFDRIWGGGMSQVMANAAAIEAKRKEDAKKTLGESQAQGQGSTVSNLKEADGTVVIYGKRPGRLRKAWLNFKKGVNEILKASDRYVSGHNTESFKRQYEEDHGGIEFTSKTGGTNHSGYTVSNPDGKSVNADGLLTMLSNLYTPAFSMYSTGLERLVNFSSALDDAHGAYHNQGGNHFDEDAPSTSITEKTRFILTPTYGGYGVKIDTLGGKDTFGLENALNRMYDSLSNVRLRR